MYEAAMKHSKTEKLYITRIFKHFHCDTFFPEVDHQIWELTAGENKKQKALVYSNPDLYNFPAFRAFTYNFPIFFLYSNHLLY